MKLVNGLKLLLTLVRPQIGNVFFLLAVAGLMRGAYLIYRPAVWIVAGLACLVIALSDVSVKRPPVER